MSRVSTYLDFMGDTEDAFRFYASVFGTELNHLVRIDALSQGGSDQTGLSDMPWNAYWGTCLDRYGVRWMFTCYEKGE